MIDFEKIFIRIFIDSFRLIAKKFFKLKNDKENDLL